jgi:hypothetical protein
MKLVGAEGKNKLSVYAVWPRAFSHFVAEHSNSYKPVALHW